MADKKDPKKMVSKLEPPAPPNKCKAGQMVTCHEGTVYVVENLLGKGGFGEVYKVYPKAEPIYKYAMKVEMNSDDPRYRPALRLKVELAVFDAIEEAREKGRIDCAHFVSMIDKGKAPEFKYYLMDLIWKCLKEVYDDVVKVGKKFSPSTLIQIGRQTLKGIESLHALGFLHRDIKAANYAIGLAPYDKLIYLLDFGIARPFRDENGNVREARKMVRFVGTPKYGSINGHENKDQGRRDDLQVWLFMMIELYDKQNIIWGNERSIPGIIKKKYELMIYARTLHSQGILKVPGQYCDIIALIWAMKYKDAGDFLRLDDMLRGIAVSQNIDLNLPLDWAGQAPRAPPQKPRVKREKKMAFAEQDPMVEVDMMNPAEQDKIRRRKDRERTQGRRADDEEELDSLQETSEKTQDEEDDHRRKKKKGRKRTSKERNRDGNSDCDTERDDRRKGKSRERPSERRKPSRASERRRPSRMEKSKMSRLSREKVSRKVPPRSLPDNNDESPERVERKKKTTDRGQDHKKTHLSAETPENKKSADAVPSKKEVAGKKERLPA